MAGRGLPGAPLETPNPSVSWEEGESEGEEGVAGPEKNSPLWEGCWRLLEAIFRWKNEVKSLLAALRVVVVALESLLGCSWPFLVVLGAVLGDLGPLLVRFLPLLARLEAVFRGILGLSWGFFRRFWGGWGSQKR